MRPHQMAGDETAWTKAWHEAQVRQQQTLDNYSCAAKEEEGVY